MLYYIFIILSAVTIFCGLMTVFSRNPIHSVLYLVICFFSLTIHYFLLNAEFIAIVNFIVYTGAIMVLFLFTLMLLNLNEETEKHKPALSRMAAVIASGLLMLVIVAALRKVDYMPHPQAENVAIGTVKNLGKVLLNQYLFPFEFASVLFLSAMIGAVLLSKKTSRPPSVLSGRPD